MLILDSHYFLAVLDEGAVRLPAPVRAAISQAIPEVYVSLATIWELSIKTRLGRLQLNRPISTLPRACSELSFKLLPIELPHVLAELAHEPATRDPFNRLLLAQTQVENMCLMTVDRDLVTHPLAWAAP